MPAALEVRLLHARPTFHGGEPGWNHGQGRGYAWDAEAREIVYWIESW